MLFQVKIGRLLKKLVERSGPQKTVELEVADTVFAGGHFMSSRDNVKTALIEHDGIGFDLSRLRLASRGLIFGLDNAMLLDSPVDRAQQAMLPGIGLRRQAADIKHLAIGLIVLPDRGRQAFAKLVPKTFQGVPEGC